MVEPLDSIISGAETLGLPTIAQIEEGYKHISSHADGDDHPKLFAWKLLYTDYLTEAAKALEGQIVVDAGCGRRLDGYIISHLLGARGYVAVDPFNISKFYERLTTPNGRRGDSDLNNKIEQVSNVLDEGQYDPVLVTKLKERIDEYLSHGVGKVPIAIVAEDMVSAFNRLPSESVSVLTCGLDRCILWKDDYANEAEREIERVLHPEGTYVSICSRLEPKGLIENNENEDVTFTRFTKK